MGQANGYLQEIGAIGLLGAFGSGDGEQANYGATYVREGLGTYLVTYQRGLGSDDAIIIATPRGNTSAHASVERVTNTTVRVRLWNNLGAVDHDFDVGIFDAFGTGQHDECGITVAGIVTSGGEANYIRGGGVTGGAGSYTVTDSTNDKELAALASPVNTGSASISIDPIGNPAIDNVTNQFIRTGDVNGSTVASDFTFLAFDLRMAYGTWASACATHNNASDERGDFSALGGSLVKVGTGHYRFTLDNPVPASKSLWLATCSRILFSVDPIQGQISVNHVSDLVKDIYTFVADGSAADCPFSIVGILPGT